MSLFDAPTRPAMPERCDLKLGDTVKLSETCRYLHDFPGEYRVVSIEWDYSGDCKTRIAIASEEEIHSRYGGTSDFEPGDLTKIDSGA